MRKCSECENEAINDPLEDTNYCEDCDPYCPCGGEMTQAGVCTNCL